MLILNSRDVRRALSMPVAIEAMKSAFVTLSRGEVTLPPRTHLDIARHGGTTLVMPAYVTSEAAEALSIKVVSVFPRNEDLDLPRIMALVSLVDPCTGEPLAVIDGTTLTAIRTAAASGAATDVLARADSRVLGVIGAGVQARSHIKAICAVRQIERILVFGKPRATAESLARSMDAASEIVVVDSADRAVCEADIVCTVTTSKTPVLEDESVQPGTHINAVGSYQPHVAEIPPATIARSRIVVDQRAAALEEAGDIIQAIASGAIEKSHLHAELGEILVGDRPGRTDDGQITLFKSVGIGVQDAVAARICLEQAREQQLGQSVDW